MLDVLNILLEKHHIISYLTAVLNDIICIQSAILNKSCGV